MKSCSTVDTSDGSKQSASGPELDRGPPLPSSSFKLTRSISAAAAARGVPPTSVPTYVPTQLASTTTDAEPWIQTALNSKFATFQKFIFPIIEDIIGKYPNQNHPFIKEWHKCKKDALYPMTPKISWKNLKLLLQITDLKEYRTFLQKCPNTGNYVRMVPSKTNHSSFDYGLLSQLRPVNSSAFISEATEINVPSEKHSKTQDKSNATSEILNNIQDTDLSTLEATNIDTHEAELDQLSGRFFNQCSDHFFHQYQEHLQNLQDTVNTHTSTLQNMYDQRYAELEQRLEKCFEERYAELTHRFDEHFNAAIEQAVNEIYATSEEAMENVNKQAEFRITQFKESLPPVVPSVQTVPLRKSRLFPNADPSLYLPREPVQSQPDNVLPAAPNTPKRVYEPLNNPSSTRSSQIWTKYGPPDQSMDSPGARPSVLMPSPQHQHGYFSSYDGLPYLHHSNLLKHTKEAYPGSEQSYTWYMEFRSTVQQWGVLLLRMESFQKNVSLCPQEYHGIPITPTRYRDMAFSLYQVLAQNTIITDAHSDVQNILNRHASTQDGYHVMYDIMERIHPKLDPDTTYPVPNSIDCADIHEYYRHLDSYFIHERFAGRDYSPREQLNIFLRGLDSANSPAVTRIRHIMDTWSTTDPITPDVLEITTLPNTIEKFMEEDGGKAHIRALNKPRTPGNDQRSKFSDRQFRPQILQSTPDAARKYIDT
jgi:hypothetical protein